MATTRWSLPSPGLAHTSRRWISRRVQLDVASRRAQELELSVSFVRAAVTDLAQFTDGFNLVYTGGHVAVWVSDLQRFYAEAGRILRADGYLIVAEYHPSRRIWKDSSERWESGTSYYERAPSDTTRMTTFWDSSRVI
ncbi:MAG: class I SAM-dependent methyltransferase [bacterium]|nr:class I SAM-dependent methyltransferase [bacterium]